MAAPFVSGLVALLLERDPSLGPEEVRDLLRRHCAVPGRQEERWHPKWGHGLVDARKL